MRDRAEDFSFGLPAGDRVVVLDDILLDENGQVAESLPDDPVERAETLLNGREGNTMLVNGLPGRILNVMIGQPQRWRLVNVANARFMRLSIPGHTIWQVGGDGGLLSQSVEKWPIELVSDPNDPDRLMSDPDTEKGVFITNGERADIIFTPRGRPGDIIPVQWHDYPRGIHETFLKPDGSIGFEDSEEDGKRPPVPMMYLRLMGKPAGPESEFIPPLSLRYIDPINAAVAGPLKVIFGHSPPNTEGNVTFFAATHNGALPPAGGQPRPFAAVTTETALDVFVGETRIWEINNLTGGDHPFHAHGWFFQPIEIQYYDMDNPDNNMLVPFSLLENKDTIRIPKRPGAAGRSRTVLRAAVFFDDAGREGQVAASGKDPSETDSGGWVFHCHILEHADFGMISFIEVFYPQP